MFAALEMMPNTLSVHSTSRHNNDQVQGDLVCVMSKNLTEFEGNYASITKLDAVSSRFLCKRPNLGPVRILLR